MSVDPPARKKKRSLMCVAKDLVDEVDSGFGTAKAWSRLVCLFNKLTKAKKLTREQQQVFKMIEPVVMKWGRDSGKAKEAATYPNKVRRDKV